MTVRTTNKELPVQNKLLLGFSVLIICSSISFLYFQSLNFDFAYDDVLQITLNPQIISPSSSIFNDYSRLLTSPSPPGNLYRPLTLLTYKCTYDISGLSPRVFHLTNIIVHILVSLLFFRFLTLTIDRPLVCLMATLIFAIHPIQTETVANIIGRAELLAALFAILGLIYWHKCLESEFRKKYLFITLLSFFFALLSKESAIACFPIYMTALLLKRSSQDQNFARPNFKLLTMLAIPLLAYLVLRGYVLGNQFLISNPSGAFYLENPLSHLGFFERLFPAIKILGDYVSLIALPISLSADYSLNQTDFHRSVFSLVGLGRVLVFMFFALVLFNHRRSPLKVFFGLWFIFGFSVTSNILTPIGTIMGERLAYLPSMGLIVFAVLVLSDTFSQKPVLLKIAIPISTILLYGMISYDRIPVWTNNLSLFTATVEDAPLSPKAHYNLGVELFKGLDDPVNAHMEFSKAIELYPDYLLAIRALADVDLELGNYKELRKLYTEILRLDPENSEVKANLQKLDEHFTGIAAAK